VMVMLIASYFQAWKTSAISRTQRTWGNIAMDSTNYLGFPLSPLYHCAGYWVPIKCITILCISCWPVLKTLLIDIININSTKIDTFNYLTNLVAFCLVLFMKITLFDSQCWKIVLILDSLSRIKTMT
jgi:hypothetical protein